eukprot:m.142205 g.142205  ORF g.142205 m.142205 type:complete len:233 (+) comp22907_c0_seq1:422-1120(+)
MTTSARKGKLRIQMGEFVDAPAHGSTAMPLCACAECIRQGYISAEDAHGMRKAARVVSVGKRGSRGSHTQSAIDQVRERVLEKQCRRRFRVPDDITPQHIEEVLGMTEGNIETAARLLLDFKGRGSKPIASDEDPICIVCYSGTKDTAIEPCGHLICHTCFDIIRQAQDTMRQSCPYCRAPILGARPAILKDSLETIETAFGTLTCVSDEEEEEEIIDLFEARRHSIISSVP